MGGIGPLGRVVAVRFNFISSAYRRAMFIEGLLPTAAGPVQREKSAVSEEAAQAANEPVVVPKRRRRREEKPKRQPRYQVILWDDDEHTYAYVMLMLQELFGYPPEKGFQIASEVDQQGRAVVLTTTLEHAELKRDQIHAYGKDDLIDSCKGSMWATIEPFLE